MHSEDLSVIRALLDHVADGHPPDEEQWQGWQIRRLAGGRNNLLYRVTGVRGDLVLKFTVW